jgi:hypothetical protein
MVFLSCRQVQGGLPKHVQAGMIWNIVVDCFIGFVPFLGDIGDALFHANSKNALVLEKYLDAKLSITQDVVA